MKNKINNSDQGQHGFTLVEMLMSIFILIIIVVGASGIYVYSMKAQKTTIDLNIVAQDVQFLFDTVSRKVREGAIDYAYYGGTWSDADDAHIPNTHISDTYFPETKHRKVLAIYREKQDAWVVGGTTYFYKGAVIIQDGDHLSVCFCPDSACSDSSASTCGSDSNEFKALTTSKIKIDDITFKVSPTSSPFNLRYGEADDSLVQPHMTMMVELSGAGETLFVQQTVPQRFIERR